VLIIEAAGTNSIDKLVTVALIVGGREALFCREPDLDLAHLAVLLTVDTR